MDNDERPTFGDLLRRARRQAGLTQELLAEQAGISVRAITDLERGVNRAPRVGTLELLADALELPATTRAEWERLRRRSAVRTITPRGLILMSGSAFPLSARVPVPVDDLIGRERELADVRKLLAGARLVTLLGPGGTGKTRLALEVARLTGAEFVDGVAFVDLAPVSDAAAMLPAIATALGIKESAERSLRSALLAALSEKHLLLVLDNLEQAIGSAADIGELLRTCHNLTILATSRVPLHIQGEQRYPVPVLELPAEDDADDLEQFLQTGAVALFSRRAQRVQPDFRVTLDNAPAVSAICVQLDGLPLAIELAAARSNVLTPAAMLERLDHRLRLLTGGARDVTQRQRTLRNTVAWSYDLLSDVEQQLFRWLAVFSGGWTLEAAEAIALNDAGGAADVLDSLTALVEHSVVRRDVRVSGEPRFGMLETIRAFALEQLATSGDDASARQRHATFMLDLAQSLVPFLDGPDQLDALDRLEREHANIRVAFDWWFATGDAVHGLRLGGALWHFWERHGHLTEGRWQLERLLALPRDGVPPAVLALALAGAGVLAEAQIASERAGQLAEESLAIWRVLPLHEQYSASYPLTTLAMVAVWHDDVALACERCDAALQHAQLVGNERAARLARVYLAAILGNSGDIQACLRYTEEAHRLAKATGDLWVLAIASHSLGALKQMTGAYEDAEPLLEEGLALHRRMGDKTRPVMYALSNLAWIMIERQDFDAGIGYLTEALALTRELGSEIDTGTMLCELGDAYRRNGDLDHAQRCLREGLLHVRSAHLQSVFTSGLEQFAALVTDLGDAPRAVRLLGMADSLHPSSTYARPPDVQRHYEQRLERLHALVPDTVFNLAWKAGQHASLDEIFAEIDRL